jgi:hypothetical protein
MKIGGSAAPPQQTVDIFVQLPEPSLDYKKDLGHSLPKWAELATLIRASHNWATLRISVVRAEPWCEGSKCGVHAQLVR